MSNAENSKTLTSVALVLMIGYYLFNIALLLHIILVLLFLAAFPNRVSGILAESWIKFSEIIGHFNSRIILTLIYFIVLVPVSFFFRRFNREIVDYFSGRKHDSYFLDSTRIYNREMFEKSW